MADILTQPDYPTRLGELDKALQEWAKRTRGKLKHRLIAMGLDERRASKRGTSRLRRLTSSSGKSTLAQDQYLIESIKSSIKRSGLLVERISFSFARHGIFVEVGVGKHRSKGSGRERPRPWINPGMNEAVEEIADILADQYADIAAGELKINIPGIYSTTISI